jgi:flavorubredoxin
MSTQVTEIADGIYRLSTHVAQAGPHGFTFNQFLIDAEEPMLFHTGLHMMFPSVSEAIAQVLPLDRLRWITFGHYEADECGAMNDFLQCSPQATVAHGQIGVMLSVMDQCARLPRVLSEGETIDLGGKRVRWLQTPHVPHGWDAGLIYEETTGTLFAGDLFTIAGSYPAQSEGDLMERATAFETAFPGTCLTPSTKPTIERLAQLQPKTLALMHNSAWHGDGARALRDLAAWYGDRLQEQIARSN